MAMRLSRGCGLVSPHRETLVRAEDEDRGRDGEIEMNDEAPVHRKPGGRRAGGRRGHADIKLTQYFNCIHFAGGYPVEPIDIHPSSAISTACTTS
jgi:hypothetical protein